MRCWWLVLIVSFVVAAALPAQAQARDPSLVLPPQAAPPTAVTPTPTPTPKTPAEEAAAVTAGAERFEAALPVVLVGFGIGTAILVAVATGTVWLGDGTLVQFAPAAAIGGVAFIAAPTIAVAGFTHELAPWTSAVVPVGVAVGGGLGFGVGLGAGFILSVVLAGGGDCICGPAAAFYAPPIVGAVALGGIGAVIATAVGAAAGTGE